MHRASSRHWVRLRWALLLLWLWPTLAPRDLRVLDEAALAVTLSEHVSIKLAGSVRVDTRPPSYCAVPVPTGGCPPELLRRVIATELAVDPVLAVSF